LRGGIAPKTGEGVSLGVDFADLGMPDLDHAIALKPIVKVLPMLLSHYAMSEGRRGRKKSHSLLAHTKTMSANGFFTPADEVATSVR
jgi:hypothetical protein